MIAHISNSLIQQHGIDVAIMGILWRETKFIVLVSDNSGQSSVETRQAQTDVKLVNTYASML